MRWKYHPPPLPAAGPDGEWDLDIAKGHGIHKCIRYNEISFIYFVDFFSIYFTIYYKCILLFRELVRSSFDWLIGPLFKTRRNL